MASAATLDLRLAYLRLPYAGTNLYCLITAARTCVNNFPRVAPESAQGRHTRTRTHSNPRPVDRKTSALNTRVRFAGGLGGVQPSQ